MVRAMGSLRRFSIQDVGGELLSKSCSVLFLITFKINLMVELIGIEPTTS
jgi:hypothetical protein